MESNEGFYIKYEKKVMKNIRHIMQEHGITQKILARIQVSTSPPYPNFCLEKPASPWNTLRKSHVH